MKPQYIFADAYLVTVLNWAKPCNINLAEWSAVHNYYQQLRHRESIAQAIREELALSQEEQARYAMTE
ncbi:MAG: hypothetical protein KME42_06065 [Tildeniella nuda ZEHNDER 1965/U140]|nr:hypothetical protein [Tildeniella nuda ZEHNDER 1965/U140]